MRKTERRAVQRRVNNIIPPTRVWYTFSPRRTGRDARFTVLRRARHRKRTNRATRASERAGTRCRRSRDELVVRAPGHGPHAPPRVRLEVSLDLQERLALGLRHEVVAEQAAEKRDHGVADEVGALAVRLGHRLVCLQHDGGRERDGEHNGRVGQTARVRREVLALDDRHQRHQPDVDEELGAADAG